MSVMCCTVSHNGLESWILSSLSPFSNLLGENNNLETGKPRDFIASKGLR